MNSASEIIFILRRLESGIIQCEFLNLDETITAEEQYKAFRRNAPTFTSNIGQWSNPIYVNTYAQMIIEHKQSTDISLTDFCKHLDNFLRSV